MLTRMRCVAMAGLLFCTLGQISRAADEFALKEGDRVVFYGDSITDQRLYTTFTETFVVTRFPDRTITFVHSGWGGDRVTGGGGGPIDVRLTRDVIAYKPTVITVMLGMNDASYQAFKPEIFDKFAKGYEHLVGTLKHDLPGVRLTLIQPSPFDDVTRKPNFEGGYNAVLVRYGEFIKELAHKEGAAVADLNTSVVAATQKAFEADPELAQKLNPDRVHPAPGGQLLMSAALLASWHAPALVTTVEIDAGNGKVARAENSRIEALKCGDSLSWTQQDRALPFPIDFDNPVVALAVKSSEIIASLDQQTLKVSGAAASDYQLKIDGELIGKFTREQLSEGINLAKLSTPMVKQARQVHDLTLKHNNVHFARWRSVQVPLASAAAPEKLAVALEALDAIEADIVKKQRETAQPLPRHYELVPQK